MRAGVMVVAVMGTCLSCASAPPPAPSPAIAAKPASRNPCNPAEEQLHTVLGFMPGPKEPVPTEPAMKDAHLESVKLVHTTLGQGGHSQGTATFVAPYGGRNRLRLEARSPVPGYGWKASVWDARQGKLGFGVGCYKDRPRHTVAWTFALVDEAGNRSNEIVVPVECTGAPMPGEAPKLNAVEMAASLPMGERASVRVDATVSAPPYEVIGAITSRGNGWTAKYEKSWHGEAISLACGKKSPEVLDVRFRLKDSYGRTSNIVEKRLICGDCRPAP